MASFDELLARIDSQLQAPPPAPDNDAAIKRVIDFDNARVAAHQAPQFDRHAVMAAADTTFSGWMNEVMEAPTEYRTPAPLPRQVNIAGTIRPATPEEAAAGMGEVPKQKEEILSPEMQIKRDLADVWLSGEDGALKEKKIRNIQSRYKQKEFDVAALPTRMYYDRKVTIEQDAERHGINLTEWIDHYKAASGYEEPTQGEIIAMLDQAPDNIRSRWAEFSAGAGRGWGTVVSGMADLVGADETARAYYLAGKAPELAGTVAPDWVDKALGLVGETAPYIVATTAASLAGGGWAAAAQLGRSGMAIFGALGGGVVSFGVEGNSAYQAAIDGGVPEGPARQIGFQVGLLAAAIEAIPFGSGVKYLKPMWKESAEKAVSTKLRTLGKWTTDRVKVAIAEGIEEAGQEMAAIYGEKKYKEVKGKEIVERVIGAGAAGFALGGAMSITLGLATQQGAEAEAEKVRKQMAEGPVEPIARPAVQTRPDRYTTEEAIKAREDGLLSVANRFREWKITDENTIKILTTEIGTMADEIKNSDFVTHEYATQMIKDNGLTLAPNEVEAIARVMNDGTIELSKNASADRLTHEVGERFYRSLSVEKQSEIHALLDQYNKDNPDTSYAVSEEGLPIHYREQFADLAADYFITKGGAKKMGVKLHNFLGAVRDMWKGMLARVVNMRRNLAAGRVSERLQELLQTPYAAQINTEEKTPTMPQDQRSAPGRGQSTPAGRLNPAPIRQGPETTPDFIQGPTYSLRPLEQKLADKNKPEPMSSKTPVGILLSNGNVIPVVWGTSHDNISEAAGVRYPALLKEGAIRYRAGGIRGESPGEIILEAKTPMTAAQRDAVISLIDERQRADRVIYFDFTPPEQSFENTAYMDPDQDAAEIVRDMQKRLEGNVPQMTTYALKRADTAPATTEQKVQLGVIPEILKQTDEWAAEHRNHLTGKADFSDLTYGEANKVLADLQLRLKQKGIRVDGLKTFGDWLSLVIDQNTKLKQEDVNGVESGSLAASWKAAKKGLTGWDLNGSRIERILWKVGGYEKGSLYNKLFLSVREASDAGDIAADSRAKGLIQKLQSLGKGRMNALLSMTKDEVVPGKNLTPAEQISFYMMSKNEGGLRRLVKARKFSSAEVAATLKWMKDNRPDTFEIAKWMHEQYEEQFTRLDAAHFKATGEHLKKEDFYSPLYLKDTAMEQQEDFLSQLMNTATGTPLTAKIGETIDRSGTAYQDVHMDAFSNYLTNSRRVERYIALAYPVSTAGKILNNRNFRSSLNNATHGYGYEIMAAWLKDTARGYSTDAHGMASTAANIIRKNASSYLIGGKITSILRQVLSFPKALALDPMMIPIAIKNLASYPVFSPMYRKMEADVFEKSNMMKARNFDRAVSELRRLVPLRKQLRGQTLWSEKALTWLKYADRHTAILAWKTSYDLAAGKGMKEKDAIRWADEVVRRTQSMGNAVDLPAFFRGGTFEKLLTTFENDSNQNYNFWRYEVAGEYKAGHIGLGMVGYRMFMSYVLPAMLMGVIGRGRLPEDFEEVAMDQITFPLSSVVLFGRMASSLIQGFTPGSTMVDVPLREFTKSGNPVLKTARFAAAMTGTVPQQVFTTGQGIADLASGETEDLRRILYQKSQLKSDSDKKTRTKQTAWEKL